MDTPLHITGYASEKRAAEPIAIPTTRYGLRTSLSRVQETDCGDKCVGKTCPYKKTLAWSPVRLRADGQHRSNTNVEAVTALVFDLDDVDPQVFNDWYNDFQAKRYEYVLHPTHRHLRERKDCWRLVLHLSRELKPEEWPHFWAAAVAFFELPAGVDKTCKDPSRLYYRPTAPKGKAVPVRFGDGGVIDVDDLLVRYAHLKASPPPAPRPAGYVPIVTHVESPVADDGTQLSEMRKRLVALRRAKASGIRPEDRLHYLIYSALIDGTPLAVPGDFDGETELPKGRGSTVNRAASMLAFALPLDTPWEAAVEVMRPAVAAMDCEPEGLEHWLGPQQAERSYKSAMGRAVQAHHEREQAKEANAAVAAALQALAPAMPPVQLLDAPAASYVASPAFAAAPQPAASSAAPTSFFGAVTDVAAGGLSSAAVNGRAGANGVSAGDAWKARIQWTANGQVKEVGHNVYVILKFAPALAGTIRFNVVTKDIEVRGGPFDGVGAEVLSTKVMNWLLEVCKVRVSKNEVEDQISLVANECAYDPIQDWLKSLVWDGVSRLHRLFFDYLKCRTKSELGKDLTNHLQRLGHKFSIACVARALKPGEKVDNMLVLEGLEGKGKTSWLKYMFDPWYIDTKVEAGNKDAEMLGNDNWVVELGELVCANKSDDDTFKQYLTKTEDKFRPPYARRFQKFPRRCVYVGTTNNPHWLRSGLGKRRYWPVWVEEVIKPSAEERDQLFAEAVARYRGYVDLETGEEVPPEKWHLTDEELAEANEEAGLRNKDSYIEEKIAGWWFSLTRERRPTYLTRAVIIETALGLTPDKAITMRGLEGQIADAMKHLGFEHGRVSVGGGRPYAWVPSQELLDAKHVASYLTGLPGGAVRDEEVPPMRATK